VTEQWRPVVGYESAYEVSSLGKVRSIDRIICRADGSEYRAPGVLLKQSPCGKNRTHLKVNLCWAGRCGSAHVALLVAEAFLGPRPSGLVVAHGAAGSLDNSVANLSYKTQSENSGADRRRDGTDNRGEKHGGSRLNRHQVLLARKLHKAKSGNQLVLAKAWGVSVTTLSNAIHGRSWSWL
jgi:hypothetical protein